MKSGSCIGSPSCRMAAGLVPFLLWLALPPLTTSAAIYFVDANHPGARDTNPGTETLPFKTISKATSLVNAGDTVFIKAGIYRETVTLSRSGTSTTATSRTGPVTITSPITIAAYPGHEGKVIISAAEPVIYWRKCSGPAQVAGNPNWQQIYVADVAALVQAHPESSFAVRQVFQHGKLLKRSRYPDTGWSYPTSMPDPMKTFVDNTLSQPKGYFAGAVCHIKTADWIVDAIPIASFSNAMITLMKSPRYAITTRYGYYLTSIVGEINAEGEWAYDPAEKRIYLWPQGGVPEGVEFSYRQYCLQSNIRTEWNVVRGLTMRYAYRYGLWLHRSHHTRIEDNTIEYPFFVGLNVWAGVGSTGDYNQIVHNTIKNSASYGLNVDIACSYTNVEGNYVYGSGTDTFAGDLMNGQGFGIYISGPHTRVYNNRVDRVGLAGLYLDGKTPSRDISYNYVTNSGLSLADAGALYTAGYSDMADKDHIHHNILANSIGCRSMDRNFDNGQAPTPSTHSGMMHGICIDERGNNRVIEDNTIINCRTHGILFHWAPSNVVQRNTLYGNGGAQVAFAGTNVPGQMLVNDILVDNILFATSFEQRTFQLGIDYDNVRFGQSDRNYFYHPDNTAHIFVERRPAYGGLLDERLTLAGWQALSGYDGHSKDFFSLEYREGITLAEPHRSRIIYNTTLDVKTIDLGADKYCDVEGRPVSGAVILQPFESRILISLAAPTPEPDQQTTDGSAVGDALLEWRPQP